MKSNPIGINISFETVTKESHSTCILHKITVLNIRIFIHNLTYLILRICSKSEHFNAIVGANIYLLE